MLEELRDKSFHLTAGECFWPLVPFCVLALLWNYTTKWKRCLYCESTTWDSLICFFFFSTDPSLLQNSCWQTEIGRNTRTLGGIWCTMKTLKRSKYLFKRFLLACHSLCGGVAQVPWAVSDALNKGWSVWESLHEGLLINFSQFILDLGQK